MLKILIITSGTTHFHLVTIVIASVIQAFGVPPILVGIRGDASFNNYKEARTHFWEDTIVPITELISTEFSHWLSTHKQQNLKVVFAVMMTVIRFLMKEKSGITIRTQDYFTLLLV